MANSKPLTSLSGLISGKLAEAKKGMPPGTISIWANGAHQKQYDGTWNLVSDKIKIGPNEPKKYFYPGQALPPELAHVKPPTSPSSAAPAAPAAPAPAVKPSAPALKLDLMNAVLLAKSLGFKDATEPEYHAAIALAMNGGDLDAAEDEISKLFTDTAAKKSVVTAATALSAHANASKPVVSAPVMSPTPAPEPVAAKKPDVKLPSNLPPAPDIDLDDEDAPLEYHLWGVKLAKTLNSAVLGTSETTPSVLITKLKDRPDVVAALNVQYGEGWFAEYADAYLLHKMNSSLKGGMTPEQYGKNPVQNAWLNNVFSSDWISAYKKLKGGAPIGSVGAAPVKGLQAIPVAPVVPAPVAPPVAATPAKKIEPVGSTTPAVPGAPNVVVPEPKKPEVPWMPVNAPVSVMAAGMETHAKSFTVDPDRIQLLKWLIRTAWDEHEGSSLNILTGVLTKAGWNESYAKEYVASTLSQAYKAGVLGFNGGTHSYFWKPGDADFTSVFKEALTSAGVYQHEFFQADWSVKKRLERVLGPYYADRAIALGLIKPPVPLPNLDIAAKTVVDAAAAKAGFFSGSDEYNALALLKKHDGSVWGVSGELQKNHWPETKADEFIKGVVFVASSKNAITKDALTPTTYHFVDAAPTATTLLPSSKSGETYGQTYGDMVATYKLLYNGHGYPGNPAIDQHMKAAFGSDWKAELAKIPTSVYAAIEPKKVPFNKQNFIAAMKALKPHEKADPKTGVLLTLNHGSNWSDEYDKLVASGEIKAPYKSDTAQHLDQVINGTSGLALFTALDKILAPYGDPETAFDKLFGNDSEVDDVVNSKYPSTSGDWRAMYKKAKGWDKVDLPVAGFSFPKVNSLKNMGSAKEKFGGNKPKYLLVDTTHTPNEEYLFKPAEGSKARAYAGEAAAKIANMVLGTSGFGQFVPVKVVTHKDYGVGSLQPIIPNEGPLTDASIMSMDSYQLDALLRERVLDWVTGNHDSKAGNFLKLANGEIVGIDKEQAFKIIGQDELSLIYKPNPSPPIYNALFKAFVGNKISLNLDSMEQYINTIESISDDDWLAATADYVKIAAPELGISEKEFKARILKRKHGVRSDFETFFTKLLIGRGDLAPNHTFKFGQPLVPPAGSLEPEAPPAPPASKFVDLIDPSKTDISKDVAGLFDDEAMSIPMTPATEFIAKAAATVATGSTALDPDFVFAVRHVLKSPNNLGDAVAAFKLAKPEADDTLIGKAFVALTNSKILTYPTTAGGSLDVPPSKISFKIDLGALKKQYLALAPPTTGVNAASVAAANDIGQPDQVELIKILLGTGGKTFPEIDVSAGIDAAIKHVQATAGVDATDASKTIANIFASLSNKNIIKPEAGKWVVSPKYAGATAPATSPNDPQGVLTSPAKISAAASLIASSLGYMIGPHSAAQVAIEAMLKNLGDYAKATDQAVADVTNHGKIAKPDSFVSTVFGKVTMQNSLTHVKVGNGGTGLVFDPSPAMASKIAQAAPDVSPQTAPAAPPATTTPVASPVLPPTPASTKAPGANSPGFSFYGLVSKLGYKKGKKKEALQYIYDYSDYTLAKQAYSKDHPGSFHGDLEKFDTALKAVFKDLKTHSLAKVHDVNPHSKFFKSWKVLSWGDAEVPASGSIGAAVAKAVAAPPPPPPPKLGKENGLPKKSKSDPLATLPSAGLPPVSELTVSDSKIAASIKGQGAGDKEVFKNNAGDEFIFKFATKKGSKEPQPFRVAGQVAFATVANALKPFHVKVDSSTLNGLPGTLQNVLKLGNPAEIGKSFDPDKLTVQEKEDVASEHLLDWVMSQHDSHGSNLMRTADGRIVGIDKEQTFKYFYNKSTGKFDADSLSIDYHPNSAYGESEPYYNKFWRAFSEDKLDFDPQTLAPYFAKLDALDGEAYEKLLRPYAELAFPDDAGKQYEFVYAARNRKLTAKLQFEKFVTDLYRKRAGDPEGTFTFKDGWISKKKPKSKKKEPVVVEPPKPVAPPKTIKVKKNLQDLLNSNAFPSFKLSPHKPNTGTPDPTLVTIKMAKTGAETTEPLEALLKTHNISPVSKVISGAHYHLVVVKKAELTKSETEHEVPNPDYIAFQQAQEAEKIAKEMASKAKFNTTNKHPGTPTYLSAIAPLPVMKPNVDQLDDVQNMKNLGATGKAFMLGGLVVEAQAAKVKRVIRDGEEEYLVHFKLTPDALDTLLDKTPTKNIYGDEGKENLKWVVGGQTSTYKYPLGSYDPEKDAIVGTSNTDFTPKTRKWAIGKDELHIAEGSSKSYNYAIMGSIYTKIHLKNGESLKTKLTSLLNEVKPGFGDDIVRDPTQEERDVHKMLAVYSAITPQKFDKLTPVSKNRETLKALLAAEGFSEDDLSQVIEVEDPPGQNTAILPGRWKKISKSPGASQVRFITFGANTPGNIANMFVTGGGMSNHERMLNGVSASVGSSTGATGGSTASSADMQTGGSSVGQTRVITKDKDTSSFASMMTGVGSGSPYSLIISPDELDRLDAYFLNGDSYGCNNPDGANSSSYNSRKPLHIGLNQGFSDSSELCFRRGYSSKKILRVHASSAADRMALIEAFKAKGLTEVNGVPIEDFVVNSPTVGAFYNEFLKPLGF
jgi:hypothetical protein